MKSKFFSLTFNDFLKGSIIAILTGIMTALSSFVNPEMITVKHIIVSSVISLLAYLIKNLFTNSKDQILKSE